MLKNDTNKKIHFENPSCDVNKNKEQASLIDYSSEENRIKSFVLWPVSFPVDPLRLAKAGFYYSGTEDEVICFSCHGRIKNWNYGDIVQKKHYNLYPDCDFVNGRSKNVPTIHSKTQTEIDNELKQEEKISDCLTNLSEIIKSVNYTQMKSVTERLKTFQNKWPHKNISSLKLAQAGFFYLGCEDKVQCPFCKGIVSNWEVDDDPLEEHKKHFAWCDYFSDENKKKNSEPSDLCNSVSEDLCGNMQKCSQDQLATNFKLLDQHQEHMNLERLGIHFYNSPAHPQQASLSARLRSFASWSPTSPVCKEDLAKAGFFYIGIGDHTKCFHCNGGLCNWETGDDPWVEHAKWFCNCHFLRLNKGDEFVQSVQKANVPKNFQESSPKHVSAYFCSDTLMSKVDSAMKSEMVQYCLDSGLFPPYVVRVAVLRQIEKTGSTFSDMNELCTVVSSLKEEMGKLPLKSEKSFTLNTSDIDIRKCIIDESQPEKKTSTGKDQIKKSSESSSEVFVCTTVKSKSVEKNDDGKATISVDQCLCKICMDKEVGAVFLPCGHLLACTECAAAMTLCPICRKAIQATVRAYLP